MPNGAQHKCTTVKQGGDYFHIWGILEIGNRQSTLDGRELSRTGLANAEASLWLKCLQNWLYFLSVEISL